MRLKPEVIAGQISDAVLNNTPYSYIRYNDGEVMFMADNHYWEKLVFGGITPAPFRERLKKDILKAYCNCDVIGITPEKQRYRSKYYAWGCDMIYVETDAALGEGIDPIYWHDHNLYDMMMHGEVNLITGHDVGDKFENRFGVQPTIIKVTLQGRGAVNHIAEYEKLLERETWEGLYFVGWSLLGKAICGVIKERGGVAVDIGAIIDGWMGMKTRSYHNEKSKL